MDYGLDGRSSIPNRDEKYIFLYSAASRPALGLTSLLSNGYRELFTLGYNNRDVELTTHFI
jgi:hypothetical protein